MMTDKVIVTVSGTQMDLGEDAATELIIPASYYLKNGKHFVIYDEPDSDNGGQTNNLIKIAENRVDVIRRGEGNVHMVFEKGKQHVSTYHTPVGDMLADIYTEDVRIRQTGISEMLEAYIDYTLHLNDIFVSKCQVRIKVMSKESGHLHIL
jgi:uncharacterized beta-barrel protein YwiB (DUF1934 family)